MIIQLKSPLDCWKSPQGTHTTQDGCETSSLWGRSPSLMYSCSVSQQMYPKFNFLCSLILFSQHRSSKFRWPLNDLSGPIQRHLTWSIHLYRHPAASDDYWLTWQGLSIGLSPLSSNCLSIWPACACARTALASVHVEADTASAVTDNGNWFGLLRPVDPVRSVSLITSDIRSNAMGLCATNPGGQFPQLHKCASSGPLVAKSLNKPMNTHKHTLICTAVGKQPVNLNTTQKYAAKYEI